MRAGEDRLVVRNRTVLAAAPTSTSALVLSVRAWRLHQPLQAPGAGLLNSLSLVSPANKGRISSEAGVGIKRNRILIWKEGAAPSRKLNLEGPVPGRPGARQGPFPAGWPRGSRFPSGIFLLKIS